MKLLDSFRPAFKQAVAPALASVSTGGRVRVGVTRDVLEGLGGFEKLAASFPLVEFTEVGACWPEARHTGLSILVTAADKEDVDGAIRRLQERPSGLRVIVALRNASIDATRALMRADAADVVTLPASDALLAVSLERLLQQSMQAAPARKGPGQTVVFIKAAGGVGATTLCVQTAIKLADRAASVALADLDLHSGAAASHLDIAEPVTVVDLLASGAGLEDTPFERALSHHASGVRLLAAPKQYMPSEAMTPVHADGLLRGLRRDFAITLFDIPGVWTGASQRLLSQCDRIVLVTQLSVPRIHQTRRRLSDLAALGLHRKPLTLVCNAVSENQSDRLPIKWAQDALDREFDLIVPEDRKVIDALVNEGAKIPTRGPGAKLDAALNALSAIAETAPIALVRSE